MKSRNLDNLIDNFTIPAKDVEVNKHHKKKTKKLKTVSIAIIK